LTSGGAAISTSIKDSVMAAFTVVAGRCAMFWVVPICAALLVIATYAIGRQTGRPIVGAAAAWIVATSPTLLFMAMAPMSRRARRRGVGDRSRLRTRRLAAVGDRRRHPYFVLEPQEIEELRARFGPANGAARLDWTPMVSFRNGAVTMYDGVRRERGATTVSQAPSAAMAECPPQRPWPVLR
jgi:hypothetical protein